MNSVDKAILKAANLVFATKVDHVVVKTYNSGHRVTSVKLWPGTFERKLSFDKGKVKVYDSKGKHIDTITREKKNKPNESNEAKTKPTTKQNKEEKSSKESK